MRFRQLAKRKKLINRLVQQAKLRSFCVSPKYKFGYRVPRTFKEGLQLDIEAGNHLWEEAANLEMDQLREYKVFIDKGKFKIANIPRGFKPL